MTKAADETPWQLEVLRTWAQIKERRERQWQIDLERWRREMDAAAIAQGKKP